MKAKKLKQKIAFAVHLVFVLDFYSSNEFENQKVEIKSWVELLSSACQEILGEEVVELGAIVGNIISRFYAVESSTFRAICVKYSYLLFLDGLIAEYEKGLAFVKENAKPPPTKYVAMTKLQQAQLDYRDFVEKVLLIVPHMFFYFIRVYIATRTNGIWSPFSAFFAHT